MRVLFAVATSLVVATSGLIAADSTAPDQARLKTMMARFVPVEVRVDTSKLPANERLALAKMVEAAKICDAVFLRQRAPLNETWLQQLVRDETPLGRARLHYFRLNAGPWSSLDENAPFLPGVTRKPEGGNFYPADASRTEIEAWIKTLGPDQEGAATGFFTAIRRGPEGKFILVPYSVEYQGELGH